mgnify:FL=1
MYRIVYLFICIGLFASSCKKKGCTDPNAENYNPNATQDNGCCIYAPEEVLKINITPIYGSDALYLDSIYMSTEGYQVKFSKISFYLSALKNGTDTLQNAALYDFGYKGIELLETAGDFSKFNNLDGLIGLDSITNHSDPSGFDNTSDLNISNAGLMHWSWNTGYIFLSIEGKVDTLGSGVFNHNFSFHIGTDAFKDHFDFTNLNWTASDENEHSLNWSLDLLAFLNGPSNPIDLKSEFLTHTASSQLILAEKVAVNFKNAFIP